MLALKWIKQTASKLYVQVLIAVIIAAVISIGTWGLLTTLAERVALNQYRQARENETNVLNGIIEDIQKVITERNLSFDQAVKTKVFSRVENYDIYLFGEDGVFAASDDDDFHLSSLSFASTGLYVFSITYADFSSFVLARPRVEKLISYAYEGSVLAMSIFLFLVILFFLMRKKLKYIKCIDDGIEMIAGGMLDYKLPVIGNSELAHLSSSLNHMSESLKEIMEHEKVLDQQQRRLITNISHDLRTPLTIIIGYLDILVNRKFKDTSEAAEYVNGALRKCRRLQHLIDDLFTYTKLINGDFQTDLTKIDLVTFVEQYVGEQDLPVALHGVSGNVPIYCDPNLLYRVFDNLFDNIRKYGTPGRPVLLNLEVLDERASVILANETELQLEGKTDLLFERMYVGNEDRHAESSGLGLSIVAEILRLMNGRVYGRFSDKKLEIIMEFKHLS